VARKVQVVLDDKTYRLLEQLAHPRAGNKSFVVREALRYFADRESIERALDAILARRATSEAMESGIAAWKHGALVPHERVTQGIRRKRVE
jgi:predicted transcriptional regulator